MFSDDSGVTWSSFGFQQDQFVLGLWPEGAGFGGSAKYSCCFGEEPSFDRYYSMHSDDGRVWSLQQTGADPIWWTPDMRSCA